MKTVEDTREGFWLSEDGEWVPDGWVGLTLGENSHNISTGPFGSSLHAADYVMEGIPSIMPQNIVNGRISENGIARITEFDARRLKKHRVRIGDIVFSRRGDIEKCALISEREAGWLCGTGCLQIQFDNPENSTEFVFFHLSSPQTAKWLYSNCVGATMPNLNTGILKRVPLLLPPLPEQKAIAAVLGSLDDKIELLREQNETLEALAQTLFKRWFIDFNFPDANGNPYKDSGETMIPSELGEIPEGWRVGKLEEIVKTTSGGTPSRIHSEYYETGAINWVKSKELNNGYIFQTEEAITEEGLNKSSAKLLPENTILLAMYGATVGQLAILGAPSTCNQAICAFLPHTEYQMPYLYLFLKNARRAWMDLAIRSAQQNLSQVTMKNLEVIIPTTSNAVKYSALTYGLWDKIKSNTQQIQPLTQLRDTLLPKLMKGEIRVSV